MALAEAVSLGDLQHARTPERTRRPAPDAHADAPGKPRKEQHRIGRADLLSATFETFERSIRDQLARMLGGGGFDPARDIVAITVNRWPHGYAYTYNSLYDPIEWVYTTTDDAVREGAAAVRPITIANSDAAASPHTDAAMLEAHRAVQEVLQRRAMPLLGTLRPALAGPEGNRLRPTVEDGVGHLRRSIRLLRFASASASFRTSATTASAMHFESRVFSPLAPTRGSQWPPVRSVGPHPRRETFRFRFSRPRMTSGVRARTCDPRLRSSVITRPLSN